MGLFGKKEKEIGLIAKYDVTYKGGHPDYPKEKIGTIELKIFTDRFELVPTFNSKNWFNGIILPYNKIFNVQIVQRQVGTIEGLLGGLDSRQLNQANNIHINYENEQEQKLLLRLEMLSGITVMGQAKKCLEFEDGLRVNQIKEKFTIPSEKEMEGKNSFDIPIQIEKLASLRDKGIITQQEFENKKQDLLSRL